MPRNKKQEMLRNNDLREFISKISYFRADFVLKE